MVARRFPNHGLKPELGPLPEYTAQEFACFEEHSNVKHAFLDGVIYIPGTDHTEAEYAAIQIEANTRHELIDGIILAMAGGSYRHALIASEILFDLTAQLRNRARTCRVLNSDMCVRTKSAVFFPDVTVVCNAQIVRVGNMMHEAITNPLVVVEVLSKSTEAYDRNTKLKQYRTCETLRDIIFASQNEPIVEHHTRLSDGSWNVRTMNGGLLEIRSLEISLNLESIYERARDET